MKVDEHVTRIIELSNALEREVGELIEDIARIEAMRDDAFRRLDKLAHEIFGLLEGSGKI